MLNKGDYEPPSVDGVDGRYPIINATEIATTEMAAVACWEFLQGFLTNLPSLDSEVKSRKFNLFRFISKLKTLNLVFVCVLLCFFRIKS